MPTTFSSLRACASTLSASSPSSSLSLSLRSTRAYSARRTLSSSSTRTPAPPATTPISSFRPRSTRPPTQSPLKQPIRPLHTHSPPPGFFSLFPTSQPSERNRRTMAAFPELAPFLAGNKRFVDQTNAANPEFLPTLSKAQAPPVLWLGCADSRVPETTITGAKPGDIFVHRNVANQFHPEDVSANAVLNFSVLTVGVQHVVVVGHTQCGGCNAAFGAAKPSEGDAAPTNPLLQWLGPLIKLRHSLPESASVDDLIRENVRVSVQNIVQSATMKEAWATGKPVYVHGWSYDLATGLITDLGMTQGPPQ